jgi:hypothetical protein
MTAACLGVSVAYLSVSVAYLLAGNRRIERPQRFALR